MAYDLASPREVALVGDLSTEETRALLAFLRDECGPYQVVVGGSPEGESAVVPILRHRTQVDAGATAYVCVSMVCQPPVTEAEELRAHLAQQ